MVVSSSLLRRRCPLFFFFFNDTATTEIYTLSLHDALPISDHWDCRSSTRWTMTAASSLEWSTLRGSPSDRKSTRLNSSHSQISYAVFCLKKKKIHYGHHHHRDLRNSKRTCHVA